MVKTTNLGYQQTLYWGNEATYGSADTVDESIGLVQSVNPTETNNLIKIRTMGGSRDYSNIVPGKFEVSGNFDYYLQGAALLRQAFGEDTASTATVDSGPKIHTGNSTTGYAYLHVMGSAASPSADSFPSFTLEFADTEDTGALATTSNLNRTYDGCRINNLGISGTVDEPVKVSVDWIAQNVKVSTGAASVVTDSTDDPYVFYQGQVYSTSKAVTAATVVDTTSEICEVNSFDFGLNNNLEAVWYISGTTSAVQTLRSLKNLVVKGRDYDASLGLHFKNKTMYQRFLGSASATTDQTTLAKYQIVLDFVRSGTIGASPKLVTDNWMRIVLGSCAFNSMNIAGSPEDIIAQNIDVFVEHAKCYSIDDDSSYV